jgi:hypothetical protein
MRPEKEDGDEITVRGILVDGTLVPVSKLHEIPAEDVIAEEEDEPFVFVEAPRPSYHYILRKLFYGED